MSKVISAATVSLTVTGSIGPRVGASLTAFTTKVILFEKVPAASVILRTKFPMLVISLFAFSFGVNINPSRSVVDNVSPTVKRVPSARATVPPVGRDSTEIERASPSTSVTETLKEPATSSVNVNELTSKIGSSFIAEILKVRVADVPSEALIVKLRAPFKLGIVEKLIFDS